MRGATEIFKAFQTTSSFSDFYQTPVQRPYWDLWNDKVQLCLPSNKTQVLNLWNSLNEWELAICWKGGDNVIKLPTQNLS